MINGMGGGGNVEYSDSDEDDINAMNGGDYNDQEDEEP